MDELKKAWSPEAMAYTLAGQAGRVVGGSPALQRQMWGLTGREYDRACGAFYDAIASGKVRHLGDPILDEAVQACRRSKSMSDLWHWARADTGADISPLVAATLAYYGLVEKTNRKRENQWLVL